MRKFVLSFILIFSFTAYAVFQRRENVAYQNSPAIAAVTDSSSALPQLAVAAPNPGASGGNPPVPASTQTSVTAVTPATPSAPAPAKPVTAKPPAPAPAPAPAPKGQYKDGRYTGPSADAYYGNIQVQAVISGGKLTDVVFLDYPQDRGYSIAVNTQAMPILKSEAISAQSANVNIVSGATDSSLAFQQSLGSVLAQAKN